MSYVVSVGRWRRQGFKNNEIFININDLVWDKINLEITSLIGINKISRR